MPTHFLEVNNLISAELLSLALSDQPSLLGVYFEAWTERMDAWEGQAVLARVVKALASEELQRERRRRA